MNNAPIWTVTRVNEVIEEKLNNDRMLRNVLVKGEISNYTRKESGIMFFTLKDPQNSISAVMFSSSAGRVQFEPRNGMSVIVTASVSIYKKYGHCQLKVWDMQPDGWGDAFLAAEKLRERLEEEGIFDEESKQLLPEYPERIGLIMAANSAALNDVIGVLSVKYPLVTLITFTTSVEGDSAPAEICDAVRRADARNLDLIILGRGGGSLENLIAFNNESVVRCVHACQTPIVTAVGHSVNLSLSDLAADRYFITPTAAANETVPDRKVLLGKLFNMEKRLKNVVSAKFNERNHRLDIMSKRIEAASPMKRISLSEEKLQSCEKRLEDLYRMRLHKAETEFSKRISRMNDSFAMKLNRAEGIISEKAARLDSLSPLKTLSRGYSLVYKEDKLVSSANFLAVGDEVNIRLSDGKISASVKKITK